MRRTAATEDAARRAAAGLLMGLLDYYRQYEDVDEEELNRARRARRAREKALALEQVADLDLSGTEWPEFPNSEVVNASIYTARGRVNGYPDRHGAAVRALLAERHGVAPERIALGNGAAELLQAAAMALIGPGDELLTPWPSYPLYPLMAARAGGRPVAVADASPEALIEAIGDRTRLVVLCNPNDPTGAMLAPGAIGSVAEALPDRARLVVDEALVHFADVPDVDAVLRLTDELDNVIVVRSFSKIYGLSGLRAGYAVGAEGAGRMLDAISPVLGVNALTQAAVEQALRIGGPEVARRRAAVIEQRNRLLPALAAMGFEVAPSEANFLWIAAPAMSGAALASRLRRDGVIVAPGGPLGADDHVRVTVRDAAATDRLLAAAERLAAA